MKTCRLARKQIWSCLTGGTPSGWVDGHLRECPGCAAELQRLRAEMEQLRAAAPEVPVPDADALWSRIEARLPRRRPWRSLAIAAFAPAVLALAVWLAHGTGREQVAYEPLTGTREAARNTEPAAPAGGQPDWMKVPAASSARAGSVDAAVHTAPAPGLARAGRSRRGGGHRRNAGAAAGNRAPQRRRVVAPHAGPAPARKAELADAQPDAGRRGRGEGLAQVALAAGGHAEERLAGPDGAGADERPASAVVVTAVQPGSGVDAGAGVSFCRLETTDPVLGTTSRLVVTREMDETGRTRLVTIDYEGGVRPQGG